MANQPDDSPWKALSTREVVVEHQRQGCVKYITKHCHRLRSSLAVLPSSLHTSAIESSQRACKLRVVISLRDQP